MKVAIKIERCKQCGLCVLNCPKKAIAFVDTINQDGYRYVSIEDEQCIGCGICYTVCPDGVYTILGTNK